MTSQNRLSRAVLFFMQKENKCQKQKVIFARLFASERKV